MLGVPVLASSAAASPTATQVVGGLGTPAMFTVAPDGRIFYAELSTGRIGVFDPGAGSNTTYFQVSDLCTDSDQGLFGLALHPDFPQVASIFAYATRRTGDGTCVNQVLRIDRSGTGALTLAVLLSDPYTSAHIGGRLLFGPDRDLYVSIGDGSDGAPNLEDSRARRSRAQDVNSLKGKILRITPEGAVPADNPFGNPVFAYGLRNVFGFDFDPASGRLWAADNGPDGSDYAGAPKGPGPLGGCNDELDLVVKGGNYGWGPAGSCATPPVAPVNSNQDGPNVVLPSLNIEVASGMTGARFCAGCGLGPAYEGRLVYVRYSYSTGAGELHAATLNADRTAVVSDALLYRPPGPSPLSIERGPDGALYFSDTQAVHRLVDPDLPPGPPAAGRYVPLTPARILDTRDGTGGISAPLGPASTASVQVAGRGGVPAAGVAAVAVNVTVTEPTASGHLTVYGRGDQRPLASNLNFDPGKTVPNLVVVKLGTSGGVDVFNSAGTTHVVFDVAGWYGDAGAPPGSDGLYTAVVPARILDTRDGTGAGVRLAPGASLDLQVTGRGGVPAGGVGGAVLNVAATNTTAASYLTVFPSGAPRPLASTVNVGAGDTVSNRAMVRLGSGGRVTIYNNAGSADVVVDVGGWYTDSSSTATTGAYTPLVPARILDTRDGTGGVSVAVGGGASLDVQVAGRGGVPASGARAVVLNATVTQPDGPGFLTISPAGAARPLASDLNYATGETRPNLVVVQLGAGGKVTVFASVTTHVVFDVAGWFS
jgi:glucose/arabinose dehydrogenase